MRTPRTKILKPLCKSKPDKPKVPFRGKPKTIMSKDKDGETVITVHVHALHPWMLKGIRWFALGSTAAMLGLGCYGLFINPSPDWVDAARAGAFTALTYPTLRYGLPYFMKFHVPVRYSPEKISFKRWFRWQHFERRHPHSFVVRVHDKVADEQERMSYLNNNRPRKLWWFRRKPVFADSYHIILENFGERQDVITVYGAKVAEKIHARLKACDDIIEAETNGDGGITLSPEKDWGAAVGAM